MHLQSSHMESHKIPVEDPKSSPQACSAWARAKVFSCLTTLKSFRLGASVPGINAWGQSPLIQGGASHHPEASCWVAESLKASACHDIRVLDLIIVIMGHYPFKNPSIIPHLLPPWGLVGTKPRHFCCNPPEGVVYGIWFFPAPRLGSQLWPISRWSVWSFGSGPSHVGRLTMGRLWEIPGFWSAVVGNIISLLAFTLY